MTRTPMPRKPMAVALALTMVCSFASAVVAQSDAQKVGASMKSWEQVKEQCGGSYSYQIRESNFIGAGSMTEIVVKENRVVGRNYREFGPPPRPGVPGKKPATVSWSEKGDQVGEHTKGAPPKTLDELYLEAVGVAKRELQPNEKRYVRFDKQNLLLSCFVIDTRIADDAPRTGVMISQIKAAGGAGGGKVFKAPNGKPFPKHWGAPPRLQTRDLRPLPGGYGRGSGTLAKWIQMNLDKDRESKRD